VEEGAAYRCLRKTNQTLFRTLKRVLEELRENQYRIKQLGAATASRPGTYTWEKKTGPPASRCLTKELLSQYDSVAIQ
jgi:hypothetical protein